MKNKLEKTGHKKLYYQLKAVLTVFLFGLAVFALSAIPVGISYKLAAAQAQEEASSSVVSETPSSEEVSSSQN